MDKKPKQRGPRLFLAFFGLSFALSGCATYEPGGRLEERVALLEKELREISIQVEKNRDSLIFQEARISDQQALLQRSVAEKVTPEAPKAVFEPSGPSAGEDITPATVYRGAFGNYASGRYQQAVMGFRAFLERYPDNLYAANAHFWLGESHYALDEYPQALKEFNTLVNFQPPNDKAPEALLRMVSILKKLREEGKARETGQFLINNYPGSPATKTLRESYPEFKIP